MPGTPAGLAAAASAPQPPALPAVFVCPLSHALMVDPVMASDGVNYERHAIEVSAIRVNTSTRHACAPAG